MRMHYNVYTYMQQAENSVLFHLFEALQNELKLQVDTSALSLDSSCIKVHSYGSGALKTAGIPILDLGQL